MLVDILRRVVLDIERAVGHLAVGDRAVAVGDAHHHGGAHQTGHRVVVTRLAGRFLYVEEVGVNILEHRIVRRGVPCVGRIERIEVLTAPAVRQREISAQRADHLIDHLRVVLLHVHHGVEHGGNQHGGVSLVKGIGIGVVLVEIARTTRKTAYRQ
jgi:hypothetical protein